MSKLVKFEVEKRWKEKGVAFIVAHADDELLMWKALSCLC